MVLADHTEGAVDDLELATVLVSTFGYHRNKALEVARELLSMPGLWMEGFLSYLRTRIVPSLPEYEEFSVTNLVERGRFWVPAAFLTMAWLAEDPETNVPILRQGYDTIIMRNESSQGD